MKLKTIKDANIKNKTVLMRVDYNVPLEDGKVMDDTRIKESIPTIEYILKEGAKLILMSHLGRPGGKVVEELRLNPVADKLSELLKKHVKKVDSCLGEEVEKAVKEMVNGDILMLENTRFHPEEKKNDKKFAKKLASYADIFVSDAFGTAHRAHASTEGVAHYLPSYAGFLIEKEVEQLSPLVKNPDKPFIVLLGGAKIDTKIGVINAYIGKADKILLGGGLANTFIYARGFEVGNSLCEKDKMEVAQEIMLEGEKEGTEIIMPDDVVVADEISDSAVTADIEISGVEGGMQMLDIGSNSLQKYLDILKSAKTVIWNGPVGLFEKKPFERGTREIANILCKVKGKVYVGGGDTCEAIKRFGMKKNAYCHVSTGGGAMLEFLEGKELPGIKVLMK